LFVLPAETSGVKKLTMMACAMVMVCRRVRHTEHREATRAITGTLFVHIVVMNVAIMAMEDLFLAAGRTVQNAGRWQKENNNKDLSIYNTPRGLTVAGSAGLTLTPDLGRVRGLRVHPDKRVCAECNRTNIACENRTLLYW